MPNIHSSSSLDAAVCEAKLRDAMLPRHGKAGPARQGQAKERVHFGITTLSITWITPLSATISVAVTLA